MEFVERFALLFFRRSAITHTQAAVSVRVVMSVGFCMCNDLCVLNDKKDSYSQTCITMIMIAEIYDQLDADTIRI